MTPETSRDRLWSLKVRVRKLWVVSPERLWLLSTSLSERGHWAPAFAVKQLNSFLYHNSLAPGASVSPDIHLGHNSLGIVVNRNVEIGRRVTIWHNVTLAAGRPPKGGKAPAGQSNGGRPGAAADRGRIVLEDDVKIGANAVVIAPRATVLRIGRGARIGAGAVVTHDVPAWSTVIAPVSRVLPGEPPSKGAQSDVPGIEQTD